MPICKGCRCCCCCQRPFTHHRSSHGRGTGTAAGCRSLAPLQQHGACTPAQGPNIRQTQQLTLTKTCSKCCALVCWYQDTPLIEIRRMTLMYTLTSQTPTNEAQHGCCRSTCSDRQAGRQASRQPSYHTYMRRNCSSALWLQKHGAACSVLDTCDTLQAHVVECPQLAILAPHNEVPARQQSVLSLCCHSTSHRCLSHLRTAAAASCKPVLMHYSALNLNSAKSIFSPNSNSHVAPHLTSARLPHTKSPGCCSRPTSHTICSASAAHFFHCAYDTAPLQRQQQLPCCRGGGDCPFPSSDA